MLLHEVIAKPKLGSEKDKRNSFNFFFSKLNFSAKIKRFYL